VNVGALEGFPNIDTPVTRDLLPAAIEPAWRIYREKASAPIPLAVEKYAERFAERSRALTTSSYWRCSNEPYGS
jgi:hypothetical protein